VGTLGTPAAITPRGKALTRIAGLVAGYGIKDNIAEAYTWLAHRTSHDRTILQLTE
jgi:uncharacterized protein (DUF2235 family)